MEILLVVVLIVALSAGLLLGRAGRSALEQTGLPIAARIVYSDTGAWERPDKPLFSQRYRLAGKPDYIVREASGAIIPIEVKPSRTAPEPRLADVMQLMAYGVLVEEEFGEDAAYGLLKYRDRVFQIEFTEELRQEFAALLQAMRADATAENVPRSHDDPARCAYCGYRDACDERLD